MTRVFTILPRLNLVGLTAPTLGPVRMPYVGTATLTAAGGTVILANDTEAGAGQFDANRNLGRVSKHCAVLCANTGDILALTGEFDGEESKRDAELFAAAHQLLAASRKAAQFLAWAVEGNPPGAADAYLALDSAIDAATGANNPANYSAEVAA